MLKKPAIRVKEEVTGNENEIQSYINSFKEIETIDEEPEEQGVTSKDILIEEAEEESGAPMEEDENEEYKYVFIVQDEEDLGSEREGDEDEQVYEFEQFDEMDVDDKSKIKPVRVTSNENNVHRCSFCNYSSNKRYLLARHMKVQQH